MVLLSFEYEKIQDQKNEIINAMKKTGFIRIQFQNENKFEKVYNSVKKFFDMNQIEKNISKKNKTDMLYYGYFDADLNGKEGFDIPNKLLTNGINILANQIKFSTLYEKSEINNIYEYFDFVKNLSLELLEIFLPNNILTQNSFSNEKNMSTLRLNYYKSHEIDELPICEQNDNVKLACETHYDKTLLTVLYQDDCGGLQILNPINNEWLDVEYIPNSLIVNTGVLLSIITNNLYKPVLHRVLFNIKERISIPYFMYPDYDVIVENDNTCCQYLINSLKEYKEYKHIFDVIQNK